MVSNSLPYITCPWAAGRDSQLSAKSTFKSLYSKNNLKLTGIEQRSHARNGELVVALIDNQVATLKFIE